MNELEYVVDPVDGKGYIWGNIFQQNSIIKIDPTTGVVVKRYNMALLEDLLQFLPFEQQTPSYKGSSDRVNNVLNGIGYDPVENVFYLTGKRWHLMFKV